MKTSRGKAIFGNCKRVPCLSPGHSESVQRNGIDPVMTQKQRKQSILFKLSRGSTKPRAELRGHDKRYVVTLRSLKTAFQQDPEKETGLASATVVLTPSMSTLSPVSARVFWFNPQSSPKRQELCSSFSAAELIWKEAKQTQCCHSES